LLYNLVESTMRNAIQSIFDEMSNQGVSFDQMRIEIKKIILQNVKKRDREQGTGKTELIPTESCMATPRKLSKIKYYSYITIFKSYS
jgi:hypothetical protein